MKLFGAATEGYAWERHQTRLWSAKSFRKIEPDFAVVECENPEDYCRIAPCCSLRSAMAKAVQAFLEKLDQYTLEDLLRPKFKLRQLLGVDQKISQAESLRRMAGAD